MSRIIATAPVTAAKELFAAVGPYAAVADLTAADWADIAGQCQAGIRVLEATQTLALARIAATDDVVDRDGTVVEEFIGLGHQRLDAPALVSAQLAQTDAGAGRRVATAVDLVTRLPRLVQAMGAGELDLYRATRIADELAECPVEVCEEVLDRISAEHLANDPVGPLGRRVRRALATVNADLLKKRRIRALSDTGLTRSVDADGVDTWIARMPLEQSAQLWDAIEDRAQTIRAQAAAAGTADVGTAQAGTTSQADADPTTEGDADSTDGVPDADGAGASRPRRMSIHAARLAALTEILMGNITGTFHLHLGVPMSLFGQGSDQTPADGDGPTTDPSRGPTGDPDPAADSGTDPTGGDGPTTDPSGGPTGDPDPAADAGSDPSGHPDPTTDAAGEIDVGPAGDLVADGEPATTRPDDAVHPETGVAPAGVRPESGHPAGVADVSDRSTGVARWDGACFGLALPGAAGAGWPTVGDPDDLIPVTGFGTAGLVHLRRAFLEHLLSASMGGQAPERLSGQTPVRFTVTRDVIGCHDETGAYLTGTTDLGHWFDLIDPTLGSPPVSPRTNAYRPTAAIRRLLTARDGRCRFPNCQAAARFADVDHVQAWPSGATDLAGLALLCRRHHRIKQRHRWHVRIRSDATLEWVTPTGRVRITTPIDHLEPARPPQSAHATDETNATNPVGRQGDGETRRGTGLFGDPTLPPTAPAELATELLPRPRPSTGQHPRGDFGWVGDLYTTAARGPGRHPVAITHAELEQCTTRRHAARDAADAERLAAPSSRRARGPRRRAATLLTHLRGGGWLR